MLKRLSILIMTLLLVVPAMAQPQESCECVFGPKAGQFQFQLNLGPGQFFNDFTGLYYLLPNEDGSSTGVGLNIPTELISGLGVNMLQDPTVVGNDYFSGDLQTILVNNGSLNYQLLNLGIGMKIFLTDHINLNLSGAYIMNLQPSKNFQEGQWSYATGNGDLQAGPDEYSATVDPGGIYAQRAILGTATHRLMVQLGSEYYFNTKNPRIFPYVGVFGQFKMARIESVWPAHTGQTIQNELANIDVNNDNNIPEMENEELDLYRTPRYGQALGFGGGINFGVEYALAEGLFVGVEVAPVCYQYTLLHMYAVGQESYYATNHNLRAFAFPQLTLGVRF
ncbi:MAG: hypothetical protein IKS47_04290 [Bacteroidales bacterium]|nr:hypothetical protein [Bacteroidales bacterium]